MRTAIARSMLAVLVGSTLALLIFFRAEVMYCVVEEVDIMLLVSRTITRLVVEFAIDSVKLCPKFHIDQLPLQVLQLRFFLLRIVLLVLFIPPLVLPLLGAREATNSWSMFSDLHCYGQRSIRIVVAVLCLPLFPLHVATLA